MAYTDKEVRMLLDMKKKLDKNIKKYRAATYRDAETLKEMLDILSVHTDMTDEDELGDNRAMYSYIADCYYKMGRFGVAGRLFGKAVECSVALGKSVTENEERCREFEDDIFMAAKMRNMYYKVTDNCSDIIEKATPLLGSETAEQLVDKGKKSVSIVHDPIEDTKAFLAVIDDIEKKLDKELGSDMYMGKCHAIWSRERELLDKHGIHWRSPSELNRGFFD